MWEVEERDASEKETAEHESAAPDGLPYRPGWEKEVEEIVGGEGRGGRIGVQAELGRAMRGLKGLIVDDGECVACRRASGRCGCIVGVGGRG